jgi:hypothetical protein
MYRNLDDLSEEEFEEIVNYSDKTDNLMERYAVACQVIANMTYELYPDTVADDDVVDLTICKMLLDGLIEVYGISSTVH